MGLRVFLFILISALGGLAEAQRVFYPYQIGIGASTAQLNTVDFQNDAKDSNGRFSFENALLRTAWFFYERRNYGLALEWQYEQSLSSQPSTKEPLSFQEFSMGFTVNWNLAKSVGFEISFTGINLLTKPFLGIGPGYCAGFSAPVGDRWEARIRREDRLYAVRGSAEPGYSASFSFLF